jgi:transcriptional regulator with XRE-family HTH domain
VTVVEASSFRRNGSTNGSKPGANRSELGAFLRSRRERLSPADVGLAPGLRRRTPGLRREEVAQLAGIGVTWYTWLEQGRPINASVQVLDAIARTLRLDAAERAHLYRLAEVPVVPEMSDEGDDRRLAPEVQVVLDGLVHLPACVYNARFDLLAWNANYAALFPSLVAAPPEQRNALWHVFVTPGCCRFVNRGTELPRMVAQLRGAFGRHVGESAWTRFVERLSEASDEFAGLWAGHDVAQPNTRYKVFGHHAVGEFRLVVTSFAVATAPETRLLVYTPADEASGEAVEWLRANPEGLICDHDA